MAGIKDVAKRAQVGVGTVSRMINNSGYVADETREKIEMAMKELNYTPNELARNLYRKRSGIIAAVVPSITSPFFSEFLNHVEAELYKAGYKMMVCNTELAKNAELEYLDMLNRHIVDGIITGVHSLDVEEYSKIHKPIVALDRYLGDHIPVVAVDHKAGGRLAAEVLIQNGCKHVLHFRGTTLVNSPYHERHREFDRIMAQNNIQVCAYELNWNRFDVKYYRKVVKEVFEKPFVYDGEFAVDELAIECMNEIIRNHLKVPRDVKIVAYDGTFVTDIVEPRITAIVQPIQELAREAVRLLSEQIDGTVYNGKQVTLNIQLRKGKTTVL